MKKILFLLSLVFCTSTDFANENNENDAVKQEKSALSIVSCPCKKTWEHKKKLAALTIITGYAGMIYLRDKKFSTAYTAYLDLLPEKFMHAEQIKNEAEKLARIATGWFARSHQRYKVRIAIHKNPDLFPLWGVRSEVGSNYFTIFHRGKPG